MTDKKKYAKQYIDERLAQLDPKKKDRIINAAMKEFTKGYKNASTDNIVREAGISKGLLFHYFGTKKELFLYLDDMTMEMMKAEYFSLMDTKQTDVLERIMQMTLLKRDLCEKYPAIFEFSAQVYFGDNEEASDEILTKRSAFIADSYNRLSDCIDLSLFREDVDPKKALALIRFAFRGYAEEESDRQRLKQSKSYDFDFEQYLNEIEEYAGILRRCFYRQQ